MEREDDYLGKKRSGQEGPGRGATGLIDQLLRLGRPLDEKAMPGMNSLSRLTTTTSSEERLETRLESTLRPDELVIATALVREGKLRSTLPMHEYVRAVKCVLTGREIPQDCRPIDETSVPPEGQPVPHLTHVYKGTGGRSSLTGRITVRHRGGGDKRLLYVVDTLRPATGIPQRVLRLETQVRRSGGLALVQATIGPARLSYILAAHELRVGDVIPNDGRSVVPGNVLRLGDLPLGTSIFSIELYPGWGGALVRAAGTRAKFLGVDSTGERGIVRLPSGRQKLLSLDCRACVGQVANVEHRRRVLGSAGAKRRLGWRPTVRGIAMNPVDHPHGGGKGGVSKGNISQSPTGKHCKERARRSAPRRHLWPVKKLLHH